VQIDYRHLAAAEVTIGIGALGVVQMAGVGGVGTNGDKQVRRVAAETPGHDAAVGMAIGEHLARIDGIGRQHVGHEVAQEADIVHVLTLRRTAAVVASIPSVTDALRVDHDEVLSIGLRAVAGEGLEVRGRAPAAVHGHHHRVAATG